VNIILFGPPGAGKGTQAQQIVNKHNYFQLSTGDLLRNEVKNKTNLGKDIEEKISKGNFVSDEIVNNLLKKTISELKFRDRIIFDGYPRTVNQSKNLDKILNEFNEKIDLIFSLHVPRDVVEKRIEGRVTCDKCNTTLNTFFNENEIKLHPCGAEHFLKRKDDNSETLMNRYDIYVETTKPVIDFLSKKQSFYQIDGTLKISEITNKIDAFINV
jgi:adenylate kinase|tara:strand:- start:141 stop:782 length:642 start_codon:yes stop_codon:yes gene_type:complete